MADADEKGVTLEVLGTCMTNTVPGSKHDAKIEYRHLWSYAQQAALIAVSEKSGKDGCYHLITDPERRAKRIAAHYADIYFKSAKKTNGACTIYWPALAAFVVKDVVEGYRYSREEVLHRDWKDAASVARNSTISDLASLAMTDDSPYRHVLRTYIALAKGNLWLFMDIYPYLWFFLEYGINQDGSLNNQRLAACLAERDWETYQAASKQAVEELPFGPKWMGRLTEKLANDPVYRNAGKSFAELPVWNPSIGYGQYTVTASSAHRVCQNHAGKDDTGYRIPPGRYWSKFKEAYFVMESEHHELNAIANDKPAIKTLTLLRRFRVTAEMKLAYGHLSAQHAAGSDFDKHAEQVSELTVTAKHEQLNVLQPLIYNDARLKITMDLNHQFSRLTAGWISPCFKVVYSFNPHVDDPELQTTFDAPSSTLNYFIGNRKSLPDPDDRMEFVSHIAEHYDRLMGSRRPYMNAELLKIRGWMNV